MLNQPAIQLAIGEALHVVTGQGCLAIRLRGGAAEIYGQPILLGEFYILVPYTEFEILGGPAEISIIGSAAYLKILNRSQRQSPNQEIQLLNLVEKLNEHREFALQNDNLGPVVAVLGASNSSSADRLVRTLRNFSYRTGWLPTILNLDRGGSHAQLEFLYQGSYVLQASFPDLVDQSTLQLLQNIESLPPAERLSALMNSNSDSTSAAAAAAASTIPLMDNPRTFRDSEQTRAKLMSLLSSIGRREAVSVKEDMFGGSPNDPAAMTAPPAAMGSDPRMLDGAVLNSWESMFRRMTPPAAAAQPPPGDLATGCLCSTSVSVDCSCGAVKRLYDNVTLHLQKQMPAVIRAAGLILLISDVGLSSLANVRVDAVVYAGSESHSIANQLEAFWPGAAEALPRPQLTFLNQITPPPPAPFVDQGLVSQLRLKFLLTSSCSLPVYKKGQEAEYITNQLQQSFQNRFGISFPICGCIEPLPMRLCYAPLIIPALNWISPGGPAGAGGDEGVTCLVFGGDGVRREMSISELSSRVLSLNTQGVSIPGGFITHPGGSVENSSLISSCVLSVTEQQTAIAAMPNVQKLSGSFVVLRIPQIINS